MKYTVPFVFHNQQNAVMVDYAPMIPKEEYIRQVNGNAK